VRSPTVSIIPYFYQR